VNSWKVILATLVIFGAGVLTGGLLVNYAVHTNLVLTAVKTNPLPAQQAVVPWLQRARELLRRMDRDLDLTPEQHQRIEKLVADSAERTRRLWEPIAPPMQRELQRLHRDIREELTPDQRKKFELITRPRAGQPKARLGTNQSPAAPLTNTAPATP